MNLEFFWDRKQKKLNRSRFNLLLLDYGEYFLEDFSAYHFPLPSTDLKTSFEVQDAAKVQGRLKLSSRSLIFEPNDVRHPLLKFPFKTIATELEKFFLKPSEHHQLSVTVTGFFTFLCSQYMEMKANNKVGPYKVVEVPRSVEGPPGGFRFLFALVHSDLETFLVKVEQFRHICAMSEKQGSSIASQHLKPFIETALISAFDTSNLVDFHEKFLLQKPVSVRKIKPLMTHPGSLMVTESRVYFQPAQLNNIGDSTQNFELRKVIRIYKRRHMLRQTGLEFILNTGSSFLFVFDTSAERDRIYDLIQMQSALPTKHQVPLAEITRKWQRREITNFEYLMHLNNEAGRTMNDLTQYPVFPHVIKDYKSKKLNLEDPSIYRDLSKPLGALNPERLKFFKDRFYSMPPADPTIGIPPPFLYGTHYSTPGYVLYYLVRVAPEYMLCLQNGRFDAPDRMFHSIADSWDSCLNNPADLKELIPEFFVGNGDILVNMDDLDLGHRHRGERVHDVELPPWTDSPRDFIRKNAKALESEFVSQHLHEWIDLIFGYKQRDEAAIDADNLYYYLTYEGAVDLESIKDVRERAALESQIQEFGQTPKQLFTGPHPCRNDLTAPVVLSSSIAPSSTPAVMASPTADVTSSSRPTSSTPTSSVATAITASTESYVQASSKPEAIKAEKSSGFGFGLRSSNRLSPVPVDEKAGKAASKPKSNIFSVFSNMLDSSKNVEKEAEDLSEQVDIKHLDEDFRLAVEKELAAEQNKLPTKPTGHVNSSGAATFKSLAAPAPNHTVEKTGARKATPEVAGLSHSTQEDGEGEVDVSKIKLFPSEPYYWHSKALTSLAVKIVNVEGESTIHLPSSGRRKVHALVSSIGKDSLLKVVKVEQDMNMSEYTEKAIHGKLVGTELLVRTQCQITRNFSASGSSLSACCMSADGNRVVFSSWDNHIYGYSILHACSIGKRYAHYDSVTSLSMDQGNKWLLSGSLDATVKLWAVKSSTSNMLSAGPTAEFADHEYPITSVSITPKGDYGAAGAEDGLLIVWNLYDHSAMLSYQCSALKKPVTCLKWLPSGAMYESTAFASHKIVVGTADGRLLCIDIDGKQFAVAQLESPVLCIDTDGKIFTGGLADGSVRCWIILQGKFQELCKFPKAHSSAVTAIALGSNIEAADEHQRGAHSSGLLHAGFSEMLVSGSDDCSIRVWRIGYDK